MHSAIIDLGALAGATVIVAQHLEIGELNARATRPSDIIPPRPSKKKAIGAGCNWGRLSPRGRPTAQLMKATIQRAPASCNGGSTLAPAIESALRQREANPSTRARRARLARHRRQRPITSSNFRRARIYLRQPSTSNLMIFNRRA